MNVFIDTTLTHEDPFFQTVTNKTLLKLVEELGGTLYLSNVVIEETKENLRKNLLKEIRSISKSTLKFNRLALSKIEINFDDNVENYVQELEKFYNELEKSGLLEIVEYENDILPEIINRAIKRKKPFSENKNEFRDAIIWLTYAKKINDNSLEDSFLITNNILDFYSSEKTGLHPDLQKDCSCVQLVKTAKEIIESKDGRISELVADIQTKQLLLDWIEKNPIDDDFLCQLLTSNCEDNIGEFIENHLLEGNLPMNSTFFGEYLEIDSFFIVEVKNTFYEIINEEIYVSGIVVVEAYADVMAYNSVRDPGDEMHYKTDSTNVKLELEFSLTHKGEEGLESFEITGIWEFLEI